jgi:hypothetical protein
MNELWGNLDVAAACAGSKRYLVGCLGGWGNVDPIESGAGFEVRHEQDRGLVVLWKDFKKAEEAVEADQKEWGTNGTVEGQKGAGGW